MSSEELKPCNEPQAHPDRCGCEPDEFQIARHSRRLVEQQRESIAALEAKNAALAGANDNLKITINGLVDELDALAAELAAIKGRQPVAFYWQDIGYPEPRTHGPYFGQPSESALCNVDGGAIPVPLYTLPAAPEGGEV